MVNRKRKLLKLGIMCLMPLLALLITISNSYAYYLNNDGDILSDNLIDNKSVYATGNIDIDYTLTGFDIENHSSLNWGQYATFSIDYLRTGSYTLSFDQNPTTIVYIFVDDVQIFGDGQTSHNHMSINIPINRDGANLNIRFYTNASITNLMLNEGIEKPYSAFGKWYSSSEYEISNYGPLYKVLNGTTARLYDFNSSQLSDFLNSNPIINETIEWNNNYDFKNSMIPNIRNAILNGSDELYNVDRPIVLLSLKTPLLIDNLSFYRMVSNEIRYIYLYFEDGSMESVSIANASDVSTKYSIWYNQNKKSLLYIAFDNEVNFDMVSSISQPAYNMVYSDAYNSGSYDGYKEGYNDGIKQSAPNSYIEGYNKGYDDGIQEDLESSGFRTLITTILSYPVNMVRESLNFEFMGIHVASVVLFIISLGIVAFVIKRFKD